MFICKTIDFLQEFNVDTFFSFISCITGVVALFISGKTYSKCNKLENSMNDEKRFFDNSSDYSQKAVGDIVNNGFRSDELIAMTTTLANMNSNSFNQALNKAYESFEKMHKQNLEEILNKTMQIVAEQRLVISGYTKIDWINIYFESAKNASDEYMQNIWAKVLSREMEKPGSFSYKTLDVLKNMTAEDFEIFVKLCRLQIEGSILQGDFNSKYLLDWLEVLRLQEGGLLSLKDTNKYYRIRYGTEQRILCGNQYFIIIKNVSKHDICIDSGVYLLTISAKELLSLVEFKYDLNYVLDYARNMIREMTTDFEISVHQIEAVDKDRDLVTYSNVDLLKTSF